jgi:uncharacterized protein (DUF2252 family)
MLRTRTSYGTSYEPVEAGPSVPADAVERPVVHSKGATPAAKAEAGVIPVTNLIDRITQFNEGREPERLHFKYARMRASVFGFFRGTGHLFYQDWPQGSTLDQSPRTWVSGELHLESFGSYRDENRLVQYDIGDFDEAALAPATWDLARYATSVLVGARSLGLHGREAANLTQLFIRSYASALREGKAKWIARPTARGIVKELIDDVKDRSQRELLDDRTEINGRARRLVIDQKRTLPIPEVARGRIAAFMKKWAARQPDPSFFKLLDVARRVTGVSHLGLPRYVLLIEGDGSPKGNVLLDLKLSRESVLTPYLRIPQPDWKNQAERVVAVQQRMAACAPAFLQSVLINRQAYIIREFQSTSDRLSLDRWGGKTRRLEKAIGCAGEILAWAQLRSSGRQGSAIADELIAFGRSDGWQQELVAYARFYASRVDSDYQEYCKAYDAGELGT